MHGTRGVRSEWCLMLARLRFAARPLAPAAALVALALTAGLCGPSAAAAQSAAPLSAGAPRVLVAFLPAAPVPEAADAVEPPLAYQPVLGRLDARAPLSLGLSSASQGKYDRIQALLDMTQGTRVSLSTYSPKRPPPLVFLPDASGGARLGGWPAVVARAAGAPAKLRPGLLAQTVPGGAGYAGVRGLSRADSIVAADRTGRVAEVSLGPARDVAERAQRLLARRAFVVAGLPDGAAGRRGARPADRAAPRRRAADRHADAAGHLRRAAAPDRDARARRHAGRAADLGVHARGRRRRGNRHHADGAASISVSRSRTS